MANPNPQLEAALAYFAAQPGTSAEQTAQLRDSLNADPDRLAQLNQQAASGQLKGFALETAGDQPNLTGRYDKTTGVITLPRASFQPLVASASTDLKAVVGIQAMSVAFADKTYLDAQGQTQTVSQDMLDNLQLSFNGSPVLASQLKTAVRREEVQHFSLLDNRMAAGATYDGITGDGTPKGIHLPVLGLQTKTNLNPQGRYDAKDMTWVLGHEIQHGLNNAGKTEATRTFLRDIGKQAKASGGMHDYTDELKTYLQASREDEASANITGWNALLSREQQLNSAKPGLELMADVGNDRVLDVAERNSTTKTITIQPGFTFNPDGSLSMTPANIAAMGKHYFDRPSPLHAKPGERAVGLGEHRPQASADYPNYYGTWALEQVLAAENRANLRQAGAKPQIVIDMAGIVLKEDLLEMEGLDLGKSRAPRPYLDSSHTPARSGHFHHTQDASQGHDHQYVPITATPPLTATGDAVVDRWLRALQTGDLAAARKVENEFAASAEGQRQWETGLAAARAEQDRQQPWRVQARDTPLYQQALQQLDAQPGQFWMHEQRENLAGALAVQAQRAGLPRINALVAGENGVQPVFQHPHHHYSNCYGAAADPQQAVEQPLQHSMRQLGEEAAQQAQQASLEEQRQQQRGRSL